MLSTSSVSGFDVMADQCLNIGYKINLTTIGNCINLAEVKNLLVSLLIREVILLVKAWL